MRRTLSFAFFLAVLLSAVAAQAQSPDICRFAHGINNATLQGS
jgi:hypothetical protein